MQAKSSWTKRIATALCALALLFSSRAGAVSDPPSQVTNAPPTTEMPWSVSLEFPAQHKGHHCGAVALTAHWLITSAHCLDSRSVHTDPIIVQYTDAAGGLRQGYAGRASYYNHPDYHDFFARSLEDDIGLVRLYGDGLFPETRALLYNDDRKPWDGEALTRLVDVAGYGPGLLGEPSNCDRCSRGTKRMGFLELTGKTADLGVFGTGGALAVEATPSFDMHLCPGDSGSPWSIRVEGSQQDEHLALALTRGDDKLDDDFWATLIRPKMKWITDTTRAKGLPIACPGNTFMGFASRQCYEGHWSVARNGSGGFTRWQASGIPVESVLLGDFDRSGTTDALYIQDGHWFISYDAKEPFVGANQVILPQTRSRTSLLTSTGMAPMTCSAPPETGGSCSTLRGLRGGPRSIPRTSLASPPARCGLPTLTVMDGLMCSG